ncbi:hypothetical protein OROMI_019969 [Orobanche minor]
MVVESMNTVKNRGRNKFSACFNPTVGHRSEPPSSDAGESCPRKKTASRSVFYFVKAVFFKTPLLKKLTKKKKKPPCNKFSDRAEEIHFQDNSDGSSLFSSSASYSRASSVSSVSSSGSERMKTSSEGHDSNKTTSTNNIRQHAMKLVTLVFWGKAFAIVTCTSAWLFLATSRAIPSGGHSSTGNDVVGPKEYKKMVLDVNGRV